MMIGNRVLHSLWILFVLKFSARACDIMYVREPVSMVGCNPYSGGSDFQLQCVVQAPATAGPRLDIVWLFTNNSAHTVQINMNTFPTPPLVNIQNETMINGDTIEITSTLTLGEFSHPIHAGSYFCQVLVDGLTSSLSPSNTQTYSAAESTFNQNTCGTTGEQFNQAATRCAGNISFSTTPEQPPTDSPTSTFQSDPPISSPGPASSPPPSVASPTTVLSTEVTTPLPSPQSGPLSLSLWVYVLVGVAAVFAMIILVLTILCIGLCLKKNKTTDSFKQKTPELRQFTTTSMVTNGLYQQKEENSFTTGTHQSSHLQIADYNTLGERDYEIIDVNECKKDYNHLQRPSPPTGPGGRNGTFVFASSKEFHSMSTLTSQQGGATRNGVGGNRAANGQSAGNRQGGGGGAALQHGMMSPAAGPGMFPPKSASVGPEDHVYRELEWKTQAAATSSGLPSAQPPINAAATLPSIYRSPTDSVPPESARSLNRRFMRDGIDAIDEGGPNQAVFFPTDNQFNGVQPAGLQNKPETGNMFVEPANPASFPVHNYEKVTGEAEYETPIVTRKNQPAAGNASGAAPSLPTQAVGRTSQSSVRPRSDSAGIRYETELTQSLGENSGGGNSGGHYHRLVRNSGDHSCNSREPSRQDFDDTVTDVTSVAMEDGLMTMDGTLSTLDGTSLSRNGRGLHAFDNPSSNSARASLQEEKSRYLGNSIYDPHSSSSATESLSSYMDHLQVEDDEEPMNDALFQEIAASLGAVPPDRTGLAMENRGGERPMEMHNGVWRSNSSSSRGDRHRHSSDNAAAESPYSRLSGHHGNAAMGNERSTANVLPRICRDVENGGADYGLGDFSRLKTVV